MRNGFASFPRKRESSDFIRTVALAAFVFCGRLAWANDDDLSALELADTTPATVAQPSDWRAFVEAAYGRATLRNGSPAQYQRRLSLDAQYDHSFSPDWRLVFADRLDIDSPPRGRQNSINTLKEAYLSWRAQRETLFDLGRINVRNGVAMGYNPTDYFRTGAVRSIVSINPASLKENRQGSVMLRAQRLWDTGSITTLYSPEFADQRSNNAFNPDWGATNHQNRWLVALSQKIGDNLNPQFLVYQEEALPAQLGFNLTALVNDATVVHFEWSGGRSPSLLTQALRQARIPAAHDCAFRNRLASGLTYTAPNKISLTAEYEYTGGAADAAAWDALRRGPLPIYGLYRNWVQAVQDLPTRQALFFYVTWQDALIDQLDLSAMESFDIADASRRDWFEARYHLEQVEFALQWQRNGGKRLTNFGATPEAESWQVSARHFF